MTVDEAFDITAYSSDHVSVSRNKKEVTVNMRILNGNKMISLTTTKYKVALEFAKIVERWSFRATGNPYTETELKQEIINNLSPKVLKLAVGLT